MMTYGTCNVCDQPITDEDHETSHTDPSDDLAEVHEDCCPCWNEEVDHG